MKTLEEVFKEIIENKELQEKYTAIKTPDELVGFFREQGCEASLEEIAAAIQSIQKATSGELSDDELADVSGGVDWNWWKDKALSVAGVLNVPAAAAAGVVKTAVVGAVEFIAGLGVGEIDMTDTKKIIDRTIERVTNPTETFK